LFFFLLFFFFFSAGAAVSSFTRGSYSSSPVKIGWLSFLGSSFKGIKISSLSSESSSSFLSSIFSIYFGSSPSPESSFGAV